MTALKQSAFFLTEGNTAMLALWEQRILEVFALVDTYARRAVAQNPLASYQHAADIAFLKIPCLGPSQGGSDNASYPGMAAAYDALFGRAPFGKPGAQTQFLQKLGLFEKPVDPAVAVEPDVSTGVDQMALAAKPISATAEHRYISLFSGSVTASANERIVNAQIWMASTEWVADPPARHKPDSTRIADHRVRTAMQPTGVPWATLPGSLRWHMTTAALQNDWFDKHALNWEELTRRSQTREIVESGTLLRWPASRDMYRTGDIADSYSSR